MIEINRFTVKNLRPSRDRIEFIGEIDEREVLFDPFVSEHLEWFNVLSWNNKTIVFNGFLGGANKDVYLVSDILEII